VTGGEVVSVFRLVSEITADRAQHARATGEGLIVLVDLVEQ
jgi:hypothetical protein